MPAVTAPFALQPVKRLNAHAGRLLFEFPDRDVLAIADREVAAVA